MKPPTKAVQYDFPLLVFNETSLYNYTSLSYFFMRPSNENFLYNSTRLPSTAGPKNKRPMGHIAHLRKQFKSINTYDYIITLIKRRKNPIILRLIIGSSLNKIESHSPKDALCQVWLNLV